MAGLPEAQSQIVILDNTHTGCSYSVKVYYATGTCLPGHEWVCTGEEHDVTYAIDGWGAFQWSLPEGTGVCGYDIYYLGGAFVTSEDCSQYPYTINFGPYTDCQGKPRYIDMNSNCQGGVNTGTVKWY